MDYFLLSNDEWQIVLADVWRNPPPLPRELVFIVEGQTFKRQGKRGRARDQKTVDEVWRLLDDGHSQKAIADYLGVTRQRVNQIKIRGR